MLEHVGRLEVLLGDRVERRDEAHDDDGDAGEKQREARRGRELRASSPQPAPAGDEERDGHGREHEHERVEGPRPPEILGRGRSERRHGVTVAPSAGLETRPVGVANRDGRAAFRAFPTS